MDVNEVRLAGVGFGFQFRRMEPEAMPVKFTIPLDLVAPIMGQFTLRVGQRRVDGEPCLRLGSRAICSPDRGDIRMHQRLQPTVFCEVYGPLAAYLEANHELTNRLYLEGSLINYIHHPKRRQRNAVHAYDGISCLLVQKVELIERQELARRGKVVMEGPMYDRILQVLEESAPEFALLPELRRHSRKESEQCTGT